MISHKIIVVRGTGSIGMRHAEVLRGAGHEVLLFPKREERIKSLSSEGWACVDTWSEAQAAGATHAIIATDTVCHIEDTIAALEVGLIVLVEKPIALSMQAAGPLLALDSSQKERIFCGLSMRYSHALLHFRTSLDKVGDIHSAFVECRSWLPDWRPSSNYRQSYSSSPTQGGVLRDLIHEIDYIGWILGWPHSAGADLVNTGRLGIEAEEQAFLHLLVPGDVRVQVALDYLSRPARRNFFVFGEKGTLHLDAISQSVHFKGLEEEENWHFPQSRNEMLRDEHDAFLNPSIGTAVGLNESLHSLVVCDAARDSAVNHARVETVALDAIDE
ncbi:MAG: Gfo/Idh/MocA family oxidoreductase [bacterium]